jgi:hypothetical protein
MAYLPFGNPVLQRSPWFSVNLKETLRLASSSSEESFFFPMEVWQQDFDKKRSVKIMVKMHYLPVPARQQKSHLCIPFLGIVWPQSQFPHSCVCEQIVYSQDLSTYFSAAE